MQYKVTSVFPFRKDWRADIRQVRADGTLSEERKRPVIKARSKGKRLEQRLKSWPCSLERKAILSFLTGCSISPQV